MIKTTTKEKLDTFERVVGHLGPRQDSTVEFNDMMNSPLPSPRKVEVEDIENKPEESINPTEKASI